MRDGVPCAEGTESLADARHRAATEIARLPPRVRAIEPPDTPYPVELSAALRAHADEVRGGTAAL